MKKILLMLLLLPVMAMANDLTVNYKFTVGAADTVAGGSLVDTTYSNVHSIAGARYVQFFSTVERDGNGTLPGYSDDTFFVDFLTSADKSTWSVHQVDTFLAIGSSWSPLNLDADATVFGNYGKARLIYKSKRAATQPDSLGHVRKAKMKLWYMLKGGG